MRTKFRTIYFSYFAYDFLPMTKVAKKEQIKLIYLALYMNSLTYFTQESEVENSIKNLMKWLDNWENERKT